MRSMGEKARGWLCSEAVALAGKPRGVGSSVRLAAREPGLAQPSSCLTTTGVCQSGGLWHCSVVAIQRISESGFSSAGVGPLWAQLGQDHPCKLLGQSLQESPGPAATEPCWWRGCGCSLLGGMTERTNTVTYCPSHNGTRLNKFPSLLPDKCTYR